nr:MAG TPA: hypothetical protein [Caudoviricetes sp.]
MIKTTLSFYAIKLRYRTSEIPLSTQINGFYIINKFNDFFNILPRHTPQPALPNHFPRRENDRSVYVQTIQKNANTFLTVFSIAVGFLTSTLFVLAEKKATPIEAKDLIRLKECFYNTAFSLITSLSIIILYIFLVILNNSKEISNISKYINDINNIGSFIIYALIILFFHSLLMVIKRVFFIFD